MKVQLEYKELEFILHLLDGYIDEVVEMLYDNYPSDAQREVDMDADFVDQMKKKYLSGEQDDKVID